MDILLIIITVVIVMGIGYILSRPFSNPQPAPATTGKTQNYQRQYENLLREIKTLQDDCENFETSQELCDQIEVKKQQAARLLKFINTPLEKELTPYPVNDPVDPEETQPENHFLRGNKAVCPQCGRRVASSDKFCIYCGHRLQP
ncbi:MAG: zinc-ribbon domain-containing protein [Brevefilum sp.]